MEVRWDAVVEPDRCRFEPSRSAAPRAEPDPGNPACVEVWLFGSLADAIPERPLALQFRHPVSIAEVIAELGRRGGPGFLSRVTSPDGLLLSHCRVFLNGESVEDPRAPVRAHGPVAHFEMILLTAAEGG
jgi:hypothetical protein